MFRSSFFVAAAAVVAAVTVTPVHAQEPSDISQTIDLSHTDLTSNANWNKMDRQILATAHNVCNRVVQQSDRYSADIEECEQNAVGDARQQMRLVLGRQEAAAKTRFAGIGSSASHG